MAAKIDMAKFAKFCKDNGFIYQSSEIYGGINGFWDYGPLGVELKKNIKDAWWLDMVRNPPPGPDGKEIRMVGLDCSIIMNPAVWVASGHAGGFADPMVACKSEGCKKLFRADQLWVVCFYKDDVSFNERWRAYHEKERELSEAMNQAAKAISNEAQVLSNNTTQPDTAELSRDFERIKIEANRLNIQAKRLQVEFRQVLEAIHQDIRPAFTKTVFASNILEACQSAKLTNLEKKLLPTLANEQLASPYLEHNAGIFGKPRCPNCGGTELTEPRAFNLMFQTHTGPIQSDENMAYLRPETAQGIFVNYRNVLNSTRLKLPFGIGQIGKAFRNEINPRNFIFRSREFEQMEIEFFCHPSESMKWYHYWRDLRKNWYSTLGIQSSNLVPREQGQEELAHYSIGTTDIEYMFPFSEEPQELEGVAHRGDYDLKAYAKHSGKVDDLAYFDEERWNNDSQTLSTRSF